MFASRRILRRTNADELQTISDVLEQSNGLYNPADLRQQFALKSYIGVSRLRDRIIENGVEVADAKDSARLVNQLGTYDVICPAGDNETEFLTAQFGRYVSGYRAVGAEGLVIPSQPQGDSFIQWGYGNKSGVGGSGNRIGYGWNATGLYIHVSRDGGELFRVYQRGEDGNSEWNIDPLDGTGPSGLTVDPTMGHIWRVIFEWYGFGDVVWAIKARDVNGLQRLIPVHAWSPDTGDVSISVPDAPMGVLVNNGTTGAEMHAYVAGRSFGVLGGPHYPPIDRDIVGERIQFSIANGAWTPIMAIKRKAAADSASVQVAPGNISLLRITNPMKVAVFVGGTPTGGTFKNAPTDGDPGETTLLWNETVTGMTPGDGFPVLKRLIAGGGGANYGRQDIGDLSREVPDRDPLILAGWGLGATVTGDAAMSMNEGW